MTSRGTIPGLSLNPVTWIRDDGQLEMGKNTACRILNNDEVQDSLSVRNSLTKLD
jgi:hypothetical protein